MNADQQFSEYSEFSESPAAEFSEFSASPASRRRPPKRKTRITIYLDDEVLKEFRALSERCGTGYQTLINAALRSGLHHPVVPAALA